MGRGRYRARPNLLVGDEFASAQATPGAGTGSRTARFSTGGLQIGAVTHRPHFDQLYEHEGSVCAVRPGDHLRWISPSVARSRRLHTLTVGPGDVSPQSPGCP